MILSPRPVSWIPRSDRRGRSQDASPGEAPTREAEIVQDRASNGATAALDRSPGNDGPVKPDVVIPKPLIQTHRQASERPALAVAGRGHQSHLFGAEVHVSSMHRSPVTDAPNEEFPRRYVAHEGNATATAAASDNLGFSASIVGPARI